MVRPKDWYDYRYFNNLSGIYTFIYKNIPNSDTSVLNRAVHSSHPIVCYYCIHAVWHSALTWIWSRLKLIDQKMTVCVLRHFGFNIFVFRKAIWSYHLELWENGNEVIGIDDAKNNLIFPKTLSTKVYLNLVLAPCTQKTNTMKKQYLNARATGCNIQSKINQITNTGDNYTIKYSFGN